MSSQQELCLAYTPGVAEPCMEIAKNSDLAYEYTLKGRVVAIVTDGSAVLGLGNISGLAALPVMEGKAALLYKFSGIEAFPICLATQDKDEIIQTILNIAPTFAAIMLEDISAPNCVYIERALEKKLNIPVFHDDQHGTAIVVSAAILNVSRLLHKPLKDLKVVVSGTGAAGSNVCRMLHLLGIQTLYAYNKQGVVTKRKYAEYDFVIQELLDENIVKSADEYPDSLEELMKNKDIFIGVSAPGIVTESMVRQMNPHPVIFALANPVPEIDPLLAKKAGAAVIGTGRSDYPNQINNVLVFPGLMKGLIQSKAKKVTVAMKLAAAHALSQLVSDSELSENYILPSIFDTRLADTIAMAIQSLKQK